MGVGQRKESVDNIAYQASDTKLIFILSQNIKEPPSDNTAHLHFLGDSNDDCRRLYLRKSKQPESSSLISSKVKQR